MSEEEFERGLLIIVFMPIALGVFLLIGAIIIDLLDWYDTFGGIF
jgi:hypothetical protein